jgi:CRISPR-associated protein Cas1
MKKFLYIFPDSIIKRKDNSILLQTVEADDWEKIEKEEFFLDKEIDIPLGEKIYIPLETIDSVFSFGTVRFNSKFIDLLSRNEIILHIFNHFAQYSGSFIPPKQSFSGCILENQFYHYSNYSLRMTIAARLIYGQLDNILTVLKYYNNRNMNLVSEIQSIEKILSSVLSTSSVDEFRGLEGIARKCYYSAWRKIIIQPGNLMGELKIRQQFS